MYTYQFLSYLGHWKQKQPQNCFLISLRPFIGLFCLEMEAKIEIFIKGMMYNNSWVTWVTDNKSNLKIAPWGRIMTSKWRPKLKYIFRVWCISIPKLFRSLISNMASKYILDLCDLEKETKLEISRERGWCISIPRLIGLLFPKTASKLLLNLHEAV